MLRTAGIGKVVPPQKVLITELGSLKPPEFHPSLNPPLVPDRWFTCWIPPEEPAAIVVFAQSQIGLNLKIRSDLIESIHDDQNLIVVPIPPWLAGTPFWIEVVNYSQDTNPFTCMLVTAE